MNEVHFRWALLALSNAPIQNTTEARIKADLLRYFADQLDPPKTDERSSTD